MGYDSEDEVILLWLISRRFGEQAERTERRRRRRHWVRPAASEGRGKGHFRKLYTDLRQHPEKLHGFCGMSVSSFDLLLSALRPGLTLKDTNMRRCISPEERLLVTLRFLATGNSFSSLHLEFLLGISTISQIVRQTCQVIWQKLQDSVMPEPTVDDWMQIAEGFERDAQFPNCIGAMDGKNIQVKKPPHSGSRFYNSKQYFSVVLLALADSTYKFIIVDIGAYGSTAEARNLGASRIGDRLQTNQLALPEPRQLPGSAGPPAPFVTVADEGFALTPHVMRPFPRHALDDSRCTFNYRLTRAHRYVESAFGILTNKWRVLLSSLQMSPDSATLVIQACVILHNFIRIHEAPSDPVVDHNLTATSVGYDPSPPGAAGKAVREIYADYFSSPGASFRHQ